MKKTLLTLLFLGATSGLFAQFSVGIRIGPPPQPRMIRVHPSSPGAGYSWIDGYWYPNGNRYTWHGGYWTRPPFDGANWAQPRYDGGQYYQGYWQGNDRQVPHDHRWDKQKKNRDYGHDDGGPGHGHDR